MINCPNCGKEIDIEGVKFCPYCSYALNAPAAARSHPIETHKSMRTASGVMTIVGACLAITAALFYLIASIAGARYIGSTFLFYMFNGIFGILAFAFGLTAAIFAVKRRRLSFAVFGMSWLIATGILASIPLWPFGVPITILAIISVVFIAVARNDFLKPKY